MRIMFKFLEMARKSRRGAKNKIRNREGIGDGVSKNKQLVISCTEPGLHVYLPLVNHVWLENRSVG